VTRTVRAASGLVASGHHLATEAGLAALRDGGSAADAAIAAAAVSAVVLPEATGVGGDLFALVYDARTRAVSVYNGSGAAPRAIDLARFEGGRFPGRGAILATVPGAVAGWADLVADHGRLGLERALAPAIAYADEGFPLSDRGAEILAAEAARIGLDEGTAAVFAPRGHWLRGGEVLQQPDLAATLRAVASAGAGGFYRGEVAERLAAGISAMGGALSVDDLAAHRTDRPEPLSVAYRGFTVYGQPPVTQGHVLLEELALADSFDLAGLGRASVEQIHLMVELKKLAYADRDLHAGDPRVTGFDARRLLEPAFIAARRKAVGQRASEGYAGAPLGSDTTYLCAVDRDGNAVSLIESVFSRFGAAALVPGTGVLLNNRLTGFSLDPRSPNALAPGKRPVHTLNAVLVLEGSAPRYVYGTPGAQAQVQTNFQLAVALIDHRLDPQQAIDEPRWYHEHGRVLKVEARVPEATLKGLAAKGHEIALLPEWSETTGGAQIIRIEENGSFTGGADARREGHAAGY